MGIMPKEKDCTFLKALASADVKTNEYHLQNDNCISGSICIEEQRQRDKRCQPELLYLKNVMFHFHNNRSRVFHNTYHFWYLNNNDLSRLLIILARTPTFLTTVLGEGDLVCPQTHTEIFSCCQYSFSAFPMNFKNWPR